MNRSVIVKAAPSLALIKYWGKEDISRNIPATSSLAVTLDTLSTTSMLTLHDRDIVEINGQEQNIERFLPFFSNIRSFLKQDIYFKCSSKNNFPTAAGLASSSSGFAALALGISSLCREELALSRISAFARQGSASAARAVYGGFAVLNRGSESAEQIKKPDYWPELRIIVVSVNKNQKKTSSRSAMELSKESSPYYESWLNDSESIFQKSLIALESKDLDELGPLIRMSYLRMFSTMFSSDPPLIYWQAASVGIIHLCSELRNKGIQAWETMDAGPQIKIFCLVSEVNK